MSIVAKRTRLFMVSLVSVVALRVTSTLAAIESVKVDIIDLRPAAGLSSGPRELTVAGRNKLFLAAQGETSGVEIVEATSTNWVDINVGLDDSAPAELTVCSNWLYFVATSNGSERALWALDYVATNRWLRYRLTQSATGKTPQGLCRVQTNVMFAYEASTNGQELWIAGGTNAQLCRDIWAGTNSSNPRGLVAAGETVFFVATSNNLDGVWGYNTASGVLFAVATDRDYDPAELAVCGSNTLVFSAKDGASSLVRGLYKWNGGLSRCGPTNQYTWVTNITVIGSDVYCSVRIAAPDDSELGVVGSADQSGNTTLSTLSLTPGLAGSWPFGFIESPADRGRVVFQVYTNILGSYVVKVASLAKNSDSLTNLVWHGTLPAKPPEAAVEFEDALWFVTGTNLCRLGGTAEINYVVADNLTKAEGELTPFDGDLYFRGQGVGTGSELCRLTGRFRYVEMGDESWAPGVGTNWTGLVTVAEVPASNAVVSITKSNGLKGLLFIDPGSETVTVTWSNKTQIGKATNTWKFVVREPIDSPRGLRMYHTEDASRAPAVDVSSVPYDLEICSNRYVNTYWDITATNGNRTVHYGNIWEDKTTHRIHADILDEVGNSADNRYVVMYYRDGNNYYQGREVVKLCPYAPDYTPLVHVGDRLFPVGATGITNNGMPYVAAGRQANRDDPGYIYQHLDQGALNGSVYAVRENNDGTRMEVFWMRDSLYSVAWPYEMDRHTVTWDTNAAQRLVRRQGAVEPRVYIPSELNPHKMPEESFPTNAQPAGRQAHAYVEGNEFYTDGQGFSLLLLESGPAQRRDWLEFVPVLSLWNTNSLPFLYDAAGAAFGGGAWFTNRVQVTWTNGDMITNAYHQGVRAGYLYAHAPTNAPRWDRYHPDFYGARDSCGMTTGHIFAVNTGPLEVWWCNQTHTTNTETHGVADAGIQWPSYVVVYSNIWPVSGVATAAVDGGHGTGRISYEPGSWGLYVQNNTNLPGFNPNDEHAVALPTQDDEGMGVFPLRCDLYRTNNADGSEPYLLIENRGDTGPDLDVYKVVASARSEPFTTPSNFVGNTVEAPYPLEEGPFLQATNTYAVNADRSALWRDRKLWFWARANGKDVGMTNTAIRYFYNMQPDFYFPGWYSNSVAALASSNRFRLSEGSLVPWMDVLTTNKPGTPIDYRYKIDWPPDVPDLYLGQTLSKPIDRLPAVWDQRSVKIIYQQCANTNLADTNGISVALIDPILERIGTNRADSAWKLSDTLKLSLLQTVEGKSIFKDLPAHLRKRLSYDETGGKGRLRFTGRLIEPTKGNHYLLLNVMSQSDVAEIDRTFRTVKNAYSDKEGLEFLDVVNDLVAKATNVTYVADHQPFANLALSTGPATGCGYVTLAFNYSTNQTLNSPGDPISLGLLRVTNALYKGQIMPLSSENPFDEQMVMRHTCDFGGQGGEYQYQWSYLATNVLAPGYTNAGNPDYNWSSVGTPPLHRGGTGETEVVLRDDRDFVLKDNFVTCRYRPLNPRHPHGTNDWSEFVYPKLAESWVKRVLAGINPFEQRVKLFDAYAPNLSMTMMEQIGGYYSGPVPLNLERVDEYGLIEIYQTVYERAMALAYGNPSSEHNFLIDNTLLLAAGRLADLYTVLGNEAYADAGDPTIGFGTESGEYGAEASSLFCFENIMPSLLDEELALLRGRDNSAQPSVDTAPYFNRLPWNLSRDVVGGEVAYVLNYEISDVANADGVRQPDGFINAYDAARLYPQGHGDAWGHYLSAITHYYTLLRLPQFEWEPRTETFTLAGQNCEVDYLDERKFAKVAAAKARTGAELVELTYRSRYSPDWYSQASGYRDDAADTNRAWGVGEWASRAGQGAFFDWVVANAMLPTNSTGVGIAKVDRQTVTELGEIAHEAVAIQKTSDNADMGLNPLGLARNVVPFDIAPAGIDQGKTHFAQIYDRAIQALVNAQTVFNHAQNASQQLRRQFDSYEKFVQTAQDREFDFNNRLIEMYGYPYTDDIGPGKTYPQGYEGPDYFHYNYVDLSDLLGVVKDIRETNVTLTVQDVDAGGNLIQTNRVIAVHFASDGSFWMVKPGDWVGNRRAPGEIQMARGELIQAIGRYLRAVVEYENLIQQIDDQVWLLKLQFRVDAEEINILDRTRDRQSNINTEIRRYRYVASGLRKLATLAERKGTTVGNAFPQVWGVIAGFANGMIIDPGAMGPRIMSSLAGIGLSDILMGAAEALDAIQERHQQDKEIVSLDSNIEITTARQGLSEAQALRQLEQLVRQEASSCIGLYSELESINQAVGRYDSAVQKAARIEAERLRYRKQVAAQLQDYRYKDMAFRIFRNDALQKYRAQFDMAARYAYLAARAYEYETCLSSDNWDDWSAQSLLSRIVKARCIGYLANGVPEWSAYDGGLAEPLADMHWNWFVLEPQLGFNNPQTETGRFSLRSELFRILPGASGDGVWRETLQGCVVDNILELPEFKRYCIPFNPVQAREPGIVITFPSTVNFGYNYFGWMAGGGDNAYDSANFATKIRSVGIWLANYNNIQGGGLMNTPRVYLVPVGTDIMREPTGDRSDIVSFQVLDQVLPLPQPVTTANLNDPGYIPLNDFGLDEFAKIRRHGSIRAYHDSGMFKESETITDSRLIGRSVWNTRWMLIIPAGTLHSDRAEALDRFIYGAVVPSNTVGAVKDSRGGWRDGNGVKDTKIFFQTYAYPGL